MNRCQTNILPNSLIYKWGAGKDSNMDAAEANAYLVYGNIAKSNQFWVFWSNVLTA